MPPFSSRYPSLKFSCPKTLIAGSPFVISETSKTVTLCPVYSTTKSQLFTES